MADDRQEIVLLTQSAGKFLVRSTQLIFAQDQIILHLLLD